MSRRDVLAEMEKHESFRRKDWDIHEIAKAKNTTEKDTKELEDSDEAIETAKEVEVVDVKKDDDEHEEFLQSSGFVAAPQSQEAAEWMKLWMTKLDIEMTYCMRCGTVLLKWSSALATSMLY